MRRTFDLVAAVAASPLEALSGSSPRHRARDLRATPGANLDEGQAAASFETQTREEFIMRYHCAYLTTREAAVILGLSPRTLERYRVTGEGPAFRKLGRSVRYKRVDLDEWADRRRKRSTSDDGEE